MTLLSQKPHNARLDASLITERRAIAYTVGVAVMSKVLIRREMALAAADQSLSGDLRSAVMARYRYYLNRKSS